MNCSKNYTLTKLVVAFKCIHLSMFPIELDEKSPSLRCIVIFGQ